MPRVTLKIDGKPFAKMVQDLTDELGDASKQTIRLGLEEALKVYFEYMVTRFNKMSKGGDEWPDLAPSTKRNRYYKLNPHQRLNKRKDQRGMSGEKSEARVAAMKFPILKDTGDLLASLTRGGKGHFYKVSSKGIEEGTTVMYAHYHQSGGGRLPRRMILVAPSDWVKSRMKTAVRNAVQTIVTKAIKNARQ